MKKELNELVKKYIEWIMYDYCDYDFYKAMNGKSIKKDCPDVELKEEVMFEWFLEENGFNMFYDEEKERTEEFQYMYDKLINHVWDFSHAI